MANLPPRPKSPLSMLTTRDRVASAQPMASRPRDDRHPPNRSSDVYFPSYRDGRRDDRDRDRYRDHDRRDRYRRDWTPPSRRRDSPDRDRRPPYRGPPRRYLSPRRGPYYHTSRSRSPPPPRRSSRSPRRNRSLTRSRSRSPRRSPKSLRPGRYSATNSPRSRSPVKRRPSRSPSRTPPKPPVQRSWVQESDSKSDILDASIPPLKKEDPSSQCQVSEPPMPKEEESNNFPSSGSFHTDNITSPCLEHPPTDSVAVTVVSPEIKSKEGPVPHPIEDEVKSEPAPQADTRAPRSPPRISSTDELTSWSGVHRPPRSPPRGPRAYSNHPRGSNIHGNTQAYPPGTRGSKRRLGPQGTHQHNHNHKRWIYLTDGQVEVPVKAPNPILHDIDKTVVSTRRTATKLAMEILQQSKHLSRQMHELQLASMDLRAAESRRKLSELHLEKARNGTLGIDYSEEPAESKT